MYVIKLKLAKKYIKQKNPGQIDSPGVKSTLQKSKKILKRCLEYQGLDKSIMKKINYYLLFVISITFSVITLGAYVRLSHAGLGCPDWPGCYGILVGVPDNALEILKAETDWQGWNVDIGKAWKEMIHRYLAGALGIFIFIISFIFYKNNTHKLFKLAFLISFLVIMQAALGAYTVTLQLQPLITFKTINQSKKVYN